MKYIVILCDGMADYAVPELDGKTPLQYASKPYMDYIAQFGTTGIVRTIPEGFPQPGSDIANITVLGYDRRYYSGRSSLEAIGMGIKLDEEDICFRCNLVTLSGSGDYEHRIMADYSSDEITTAESTILIKQINKIFGGKGIRFYPGISYRHCMVWNGAEAGFVLTPPHDILNKEIGPYLPSGPNSGRLKDMMLKSVDILSDHPVNKARIRNDLKPANSVWFWGEGKKPSLPGFFSKYGLKGSVISAVDLIKGIGVCAGLRPVAVEGATGNIQTNFEGKAMAAIHELESGQDFVYIHIEAPDECGHRYEISNKVKSIELIDKLVLGAILKELSKREQAQGFEDYSILVLPDHATPLKLRTHTYDPVPFVIYTKSAITPSGIGQYDEASAASSKLIISEGHNLMDLFLNRR